MQQFIIDMLQFSRTDSATLKFLHGGLDHIYIKHVDSKAIYNTQNIKTIYILVA